MTIRYRAKNAPKRIGIAQWPTIGFDGTRKRATPNSTVPSSLSMTALVNAPSGMRNRIYMGDDIILCCRPADGSLAGEPDQYKPMPPPFQMYAVKLGSFPMHIAGYNVELAKDGLGNPLGCLEWASNSFVGIGDACGSVGLWTGDLFVGDLSLNRVGRIGMHGGNPKWWVRATGATPYPGPRSDLVQDWVLGYVYGAWIVDDDAGLGNSGKMWGATQVFADVKVPSSTGGAQPAKVCCLNTIDGSIVWQTDISVYGDFFQRGDNPIPKHYQTTIQKLTTEWTQIIRADGKIFARLLSGAGSTRVLRVVALNETTGAVLWSTLISSSIVYNTDAYTSIDWLQVADGIILNYTIDSGGMQQGIITKLYTSGVVAWNRTIPNYIQEHPRIYPSTSPPAQYPFTATAISCSADNSWLLMSSFYKDIVYEVAADGITPILYDNNDGSITAGEDNPGHSYTQVSHDEYVFWILGYSIVDGLLWEEKIKRTRPRNLPVPQPNPLPDSYTDFIGKVGFAGAKALVLRVIKKITGGLTVWQNELAIFSVSGRLLGWSPTPNNLLIHPWGDFLIYGGVAYCVAGTDYGAELVNATISPSDFRLYKIG